jgi:membrane-associated phospholipid phosphatase
MKCPFKLDSVLVFVAFLILAIEIFITHNNQSLFLTINSMHDLVPVKVWELVNLVSYSKYMILPILLLAITFIWKKDKLPNVIILIAAYFVVFAVLKALFGVARPYIVLDTNSFYWLNMYENAVKSAHKSFPSGHVGNMAVFAFAISSMFFAKSRGLQFLMLLLVIFTGITRICTGWHWPLDVITSGLIGYLLVKICLSIQIVKDKYKK